MFSWFRDAYVSHLRDEIAWLRQQMLAERLRAERACDLLLALRVPGAVPITPTPAEVRDANSVTLEESPDRVVQRLLNDAEFQAAGGA